MQNTATKQLVSFDHLHANLVARTEEMVNQKQISYLKQQTEAQLRELLELTAGYVYLGIRQNKTMAQVVSDIGHKVRDVLELKRDSSLAAKTGTFFLESYALLGLIDIEESMLPRSKNSAYFVISKDDDSLSELWEAIRPEKCESLPKLTPPEDWISGIHTTGLALIKHAPLKVLSKINLADHHEVISTLNRYQNQGWIVNQDVLKVYTRLSNMKHENLVVHRVTDPETGEIDTTFPFDWMMEEERKARKSKRLEANSIKRMAKKMGKHTFYHQYNCDFRGRIYPLTAFLHEQGSDNAQGLLLLAKGKPLGDNGYDWLLYHMTNAFGEDKLGKQERIDFSRTRIQEYINYAKNPYENTGWMLADQRWAFLAGCYQLYSIMQWVMAGNAIEDYVCNLPIYIDGSNNGVQHLTALSKDHTVAHLVNLVPTDKPGDAYAYIANHTWADFVAPQTSVVEETTKAAYEVVFNAMAELKDKLRQTQRMTKEERKDIYGQINTIRDNNKELLEKCKAYYWSKVDSAKKKRTVCKRPTMTLGYGGTAWGMGDQILKDTQKTSEHYFKIMEVSQARWMGRAIHESCLKHLPGPAKMLEMFQKVAEEANKKDIKLSWVVPGTNFPVVQQYRKAEVRRVAMDYCGRVIRLNIQIVEEKYLDTAKQVSAAAPNVIHSFDAAHLVMTVNACKFACVTVHDSFGCLPGDMQDMSRIVREQFVAFYALDPMNLFLAQHECEHLAPQLGDLDVTQILQADFAFH